MVSFNCDGCGDVVKKPKLDQHYQRCYAPVTCLDCSTQFSAPIQWKGHTTCVSEAQKYERSVYKAPKGKRVHQRVMDGDKQAHSSESITSQSAASDLSNKKSINGVVASTGEKGDAMSPSSSSASSSKIIVDAGEKKHKKEKSDRQGAEASSDRVSEEEKSKRDSRKSKKEQKADKQKIASGEAISDASEGMGKPKKSKKEGKRASKRDESAVALPAEAALVGPSREGKSKKRKSVGGEAGAEDRVKKSKKDKKADKSEKLEIQHASEAKNERSDKVSKKKGSGKKSKKREEQNSAIGEEVPSTSQKPTFPCERDRGDRSDQGDGAHLPATGPVANASSANVTQASAKAKGNKKDKAKKKKKKKSKGYAHLGGQERPPKASKKDKYARCRAERQAKREFKERQAQYLASQGRS